MDATEVPAGIPLGPAEAVVRQALADQGFGVLTEIDVAAISTARLGVDRPPLKILGACNPGLAHRALELDPSASLLPPVTSFSRPNGKALECRSRIPGC
jgi:hypothetical protein